MTIIYIAHKDNHMAGMCAACEPRMLGQFLAKFTKDGFDFIPCETREQYDHLIKTMPMWSQHPGYKALLQKVKRRKEYR